MTLSWPRSWCGPAVKRKWRRAAAPGIRFPFVDASLALTAGQPRSSRTHPQPVSYGRQYRNIWTKDAHGGAYRQVTGSKGGYDPLLQDEDGRTLAVRARCE